MNKTETPPVNSAFSFGDCKICGDIATGIHYGIATCEACKVKIKQLNKLSQLLLIKFF